MDKTSPLLATESSVLQPTVLRSAGLLVAGIVLACVLSFAGAAVFTVKYPIILSHAMLAFALGLRHAVDCDHLAAIDNVTRQLINRGQFPISVGFWFALGHSMVVYAMTAIIAGGYSVFFHSDVASSITDSVSLVAAAISVSLLAGVGMLNARVAFLLFQDWSSLKKQNSEVQNETLEQQGQDSLRSALSLLPVMKRIFGRVDKPYKMFVVGLLFGLSFDTATQVGVIGLAAMAGTRGGMPPLIVLIFPVCFSCGMCLVDTSNGLLMLFTYSYATISPMKKLLYNFLVTAMSACVALLIGTLELLQLISEQADLAGPFWSWINNVDMGLLGYLVIASFVLVFGSAACYSCVAARQSSSNNQLLA